ncbi:MAG: PKD domain-containing protein [Bacteroidales bacterium]
MIKIKIFSFLFGIGLFINSVLFGQVHASFTANPTHGCAPMTVSFINNSTGTGTLTYQWNFGNGNSSNLQNPTANYINPGTYTVTLIVSNGSQSDTMVLTNYIHVFQNPTASFTINPTTGCVPLNVSFTNTSQLGDTIITNYVWDFGDGGSSNQQNPSHNYTQPGGYGVSLQITDGHGCHASFTQQGAVIVSSIPQVAFTADYTSNCTAPFTVIFHNQSTGMGTLTYLWNFGDGTTSTAQNPTHTYTQSGSYSVSLQVTNQYGCSNDTTYTNYINISNVNAAFHTNVGDTVCINQTVQFINDAGTTALWSFGDGGTSTLSNPTHVYTTSGTYVVMMIAAPGTPCQDTAYRTILVRSAPNAQFSFSPTFSCGNPITFTPLNTNGTSYQWNFGDNTSGTGVNPNHTYQNNGTYYVSLILTDSYGCQGAYQSPTPIIVEKPVASFDANPKEGCKPLPVSFTDSSSCNTNFTHFTAWSWDFGDGHNSSLQNPNHTFADTGVFTVTLTVTTDLGCTATTTLDIQVGEHQHPQVQYTYTGGCANDTVNFISLSTDANYIDSYNWQFVNDSNLVVGTSTETNPSIPFHGNGYISLTYTINHNGCYDTLKLDSIFVLNGPYTGHIDTIMVGCHNPYLVGAVMPFIKQANRWYWDMDGDGVYDDSTIYVNPVYSLGDTSWFTYPSRGTYNIHFIAYNDSSGCFWEENMSIKIKDIRANLAVTSPTCPNQVHMNTANSQDFDQITFVYGDGTMHTLSYTDFLLDTLIYHQYVYHNYPNHSDTVTAYLIVSNNIGCVDTDSVTIRIFYPQPGFMGNPLHFCVPYNVLLTDTSHADTTIVGWQWTVNPGNLTSTAQNPTFSVSNPGNYSVQLTVVDALGCSATKTLNSYIHADLLQGNFSCLDNTLCLGDTVHFISSLPNVTQYIWDYGDGSSLDTAINPSHFYSNVGKYTVTLYVENNLPGCKDTVIANNYVQIQDIDVHFSVLDADSNCYPFPITIYNTTDTTFNPTWLWNFGDGGLSFQQTPFHNYTHPGNFWLSLEATTSFGCKDKDSLLISVGGPYTQITMSDSIICKGATVDFNVTQNQNILIYNWDFGDGATSNGIPTSHTYNYYPSNGYFVPSLIYCSDATCCQSASDTLYVHQVFADFSYVQDNGSTDSVACAHATLLFSNNSMGGDSYVWSFGDGTTDSNQIPNSHYYVNTGQTQQTFYINLLVTSQIGCVDSIKKPFVLYPLPIIQLGNDVAVCQGSSVQLSASGGNSIIWQPIQGLDNPSSYFPNASPDSTTTYTATIYDTHGCSNSQSVTVYVQQQPLLNNSSDTTIIIGEQVNLWANSDQSSVSYQWSPATGLSCTNCPNPIAQPLQNTTYTVLITDTMNCFQVTGSVHIEVKEEYTIDVPSAFTPNGDGNNDIIYVRGWGIKQLQEFKIFNRWGQCVFETDDLHQGWDGTFKGIKQDMDTYAYTVKALTYGNKTMTKNGLINLIR